MKKKQITIIVMAALLVALVIAYYAVSAGFAGDEIDTDAQTGAEYITVSSINSDGVVGLSFTSDGVEYSFSRAGGVWSYDADATFPTDKKTLDSMLSAVSGIRAERAITDADVNSAEYGLDTPRHTVKVKMTDSSEHIFNIGDYNKHAGQYYMTAQGQGSVYMVTASFGELFDVELYDLLALEEMEDITASDVTALKAEGSFGTVRLDVTETTEDGKTSKVYTHTNAEGGTAVLEADKGAAVVSALSYVKLDKCADHHAGDDELGAFGLDEENRIRITVYYKMEITADTSAGTSIGGSTSIDKEYVYYIGRVTVEQDDLQEGTDTSAQTSADTPASDTEAEDTEEKAPATTTKTYLMLEGSSMVYEVNISAADVFFE